VTKSIPYSLPAEVLWVGPSICLDLTPVITSIVRIVRFSEESIVVPHMILAFGSIRE
jgi:hypothetical protein